MQQCAANTQENLALEAARAASLATAATTHTEAAAGNSRRHVRGRGLAGTFMRNYRSNLLGPGSAGGADGGTSEHSDVEDGGAIVVEGEVGGEEGGEDESEEDEVANEIPCLTDGNEETAGKSAEE